MNIHLDPIKKKIKELTLIAEWRNQLLETLRTTHPTSTKYEDQCAWVDSLTKDNEQYFFIYNNLNEIIGYTGLDKINLVNKTAELGLLIGTPYQHQGLGKKAVFLILQYAFNNLSLNCIFIEVYLTTNNWKRFWKKLDFKKEGLLKNRKYWNGNYYDSVIASMQSNDWLKLRKTKFKDYH